MNIMMMSCVYCLSALTILCVVLAKIIIKDTDQKIRDTQLYSAIFNVHFGFNLLKKTATINGKTNNGPTFFNIVITDNR